MNETILEIKKIKKELGEKLIILTHHYQREEIVKLGDFVGDSFKLAKSASEQKNAKYIVFCGVHFMAEAARILAKSHQRVFIPDKRAGCPMADMATLEEVQKAWDELSQNLSNKKIIPITYMNSNAELKAFCGKNDGIVCTSSNAKKAFKWAYERGEVVLFFPDQYLGRNTANFYGIPKNEQILWQRNIPLGGNSLENLKKAKVILWNGYCHVHQWFNPQHIKESREKHKDAKIVVHPECDEKVVKLADANGSTAFIVDFVKKANKGDTIVIGTEINLVSRLAHENPHLKIEPLSPSLCPNMYKISPKKLLNTLKSLDSDEYEVFVDPEVTHFAKLALDRMLAM